MTTAQPTTGLDITTKFFFLAFLLFFFKPTVVIDNQPNVGPWGTYRYPVAPGHHTVRIFFKYLFLREACAAETSVDVPEGAVVPITYKAPWLILLPGRITVG